MGVPENSSKTLNPDLTGSVGRIWRCELAKQQIDFFLFPVYHVRFPCCLEMVSNERYGIYIPLLVMS